MDLEVVGRLALLFDDDTMTTFFNSVAALVDWNSRSIDRDDIRHLLSAPPLSRSRRCPPNDPLDSDLDLSWVIKPSVVGGFEKSALIAKRAQQKGKIAVISASMQYCMQKTYYKTTSLISISCKAIALLAGQITKVAMLAFEYGKNLGIVTALILFAMEEFPQLRAIVDQGFDKPESVDILTAKHAELAAQAIDSLPEMMQK
ncbi:hypothetical protein K2173_017427 [Erythroxylum novogranatense]|uniref:Suppressor of white apricot N-terminal domain-containing protein n=1 Tax=Erythroxylum novogranatense TaxID=1862640 RepID=A0AAV8TKY5_9ROSI|nr:hypothetical protein K2173_017427 [Erythroxylum novogranatense]